MESKTDYAACLKTVTDFSVAYIKLISRGVFFLRAFAYVNRDCLKVIY